MINVINEIVLKKKKDSIIILKNGQLFHAY